MDSDIRKEKLDVENKIIGLAIFGVLCGLLLVVFVNFSINMSAGVRSYVGGEAHWTKAQKQATLHLMNYINTRDEAIYDLFLDDLDVNLGDKQARLELLKEEYNYEKVREGFLRGNNHPEDIPHMITVFRLFHELPTVESAIATWEKADAKILELIELGEQIHTQLPESPASKAQKAAWSNRLVELDAELTQLEVDFSADMGKAARFLEDILMWSTIGMGLLLLFTGGILSHNLVKSAGKWGEQLQKSEQKFRNVLSNSRDVVYQMDLEDRSYTYVSPSVEEVLGYTQEELLEGGADFVLSKVHPDDVERMQNELKQLSEMGDDEVMLTDTEYRIRNKDGQYIWVNNVRNLVNGNPNQSPKIVGNVRDITHRKQQEKELKQSLDDKEFLLKEIHHRLKNNLAIISSLLELQKSSAGQETVKILAASQSRINSIAKVHEKLYESTTFSDVDMKSYVNELVEEISRAYVSEKRDINIETDIDSITLDIEHVIPCGLILNELINNAYKHGFKNRKEGTLRILFKKAGEKLILTVENDGENLPEGFDPAINQSLGMTLIDKLSKKFDAELTIESNDWTRFQLQFKVS